MTVSFDGSLASFIIPIVTGTLSTIGSLVILNIILQSTIKLGTTHHRIMASMSVFDIIASICMALSTLPMPSDTVFRNGRPMWGNKVTCQIQGFLIVLGFCGGAFLYTCLSWYMVCKITFRMNDYTIRNKIEPYMLIIAVVLALTGAIFFLVKDLINPSFSNSFCFVASYSEDCNNVNGIDAWFECDSREEAAMEPYERAKIVVAVVVTINVVFILVAMFLIIQTVCDQKKKIEKANNQILDTNAPRENVIFISESSTSDNHEQQQYNTADRNYSRVLILQALMYIAAFFVTWIFMILCIILGCETLPFLEISKAVLLPLQGFWNMIIFVYDKAYLVRQVDPSISWWQAVQNVFLCPNEIPMTFLTNLTMVEETRNAEDPNLSQASRDHEVVLRTPEEITMAFLMNLTKVEESSNHGDAEASKISKDPEDDVIANDLVENVVASNEKNDMNFSHSTQKTKGLRRPGMLRFTSPSLSNKNPAIASVGSSFEPMSGSSISGGKLSYTSRNGVQSLECSASGTLSHNAAAASVGSSFEPMTGSSISGGKMSYTSRNIESLECSVRGAFSDESID